MILALALVLLGQTNDCAPGRVCRPYALQTPCVATTKLPTCNATTRGRSMCDSSRSCIVTCFSNAWSCASDSTDGGANVYTGTVPVVVTAGTGAISLQYVPAPVCTAPLVCAGSAFDGGTAKIVFPDGGAFVATTSAIANVKDYGALCDGTTDDSAAIQAALNASTSVFIPAGTCVATGLTVTTDNTTISGVGVVSVLSLKAGSSVLLLNGGTHPLSLRNMRLTGGAVTGCKTSCSTSTTRDGVRMVSQANAVIDNVTFDGFDHYALDFVDAATARNAPLAIAHSTFFQNYIAVRFADVDSEYVRMTGLNVSNSLIGVYIGSGNVQLVGSKVTDCGYGVYIDGTLGANNAHGVISGNLINHSGSYSLYIDSATNGEVITGNTIIDGPIKVIGSRGVQITGGTVDVQVVEFSGGWVNRMVGNHILSGYNNTVTHTSDSSLVYDNVRADGGYLDAQGLTLTLSGLLSAPSIKQNTHPVVDDTQQVLLANSEGIAWSTGYARTHFQVPAGKTVTVTHITGIFAAGTGGNVSTTPQYQWASVDTSTTGAYGCIVAAPCSGNICPDGGQVCSLPATGACAFDGGTIGLGFQTSGVLCVTTQPSLVAFGVYGTVQ